MDWLKDEDSPYPDSFRAQDGRFHAVTWQFGEGCHQAKVIIEYDHTRHNHTTCEGPSVGICLEHGKTLDEAKARCEAFIESYKASGPDTPEADRQRSFREYPSLHKYDWQILANWFVHGGGNGYDWLDGAVYYSDRAPPPDFSHMEDEAKKLKDAMREARRLLAEYNPEALEELGPDSEDEPKERPLPDDGGPLDLKLTEGHFCSKLLSLPPDLRPEWRRAALQAAQMLVERSTDARTRELAQGVLDGLQGNEGP